MESNIIKEGPAIGSDGLRETLKNNTNLTPLHNQSDYEAELIEAMRLNGIQYKGLIVADGVIHRFANGGKGNKDCWYISFGNAGAFGDWGNDIKKKWSTAYSHSLFSTEKKELQKQIEASQRAYQEEIERKHLEAALQAEEELGSFDEEGNSPYLTNKQVNVFGILFGKNFIAIPLGDIEGKLHSLQKIYHDGTKRFLKGGRIDGCFHVIGAIEEGKPIYVVEGYATGASVHMATLETVIVAFNAGNLLKVVEAVKKRYPTCPLIIAGDEDCWKKKNIGREKAEEAANTYGCRVVFPKFINLDTKPTDWNDLHCLEGIEIVKNQIDKAQFVELNDEQTLIYLANLSKIEYDRQRKDRAKKLGIQVSTLDDEVEKRRATLSKDPSAEELTQFPAIDPWPEAVIIGDLLQELSDVFARFAILPPHASTALALWILFTWCIDEVNIAPILAICSPEKQCGKTTVLSLINQLVLRALSSSNITPAALFRSIEQWKPTLLIDEADTFIRNSDELRGILNSGHTRDTAYVIRTVGENHEPKCFNTWGAKAIALIGKLPDTLHDRSIVINLRRKLIGEKTEKLRRANPEVFSRLKRKLSRFSQDNVHLLKNTQAHPLDHLSDRAADNWEPLLAIAELAGSEWLEKALQAAQSLSTHENDDDTNGTELLRDIQQVFESQKNIKVSTADLIEFLCQDSESPWSTFNPGQQHITPRQLAKRLSPYDIHSKNIKMNDGTVSKGFEKSQFEDAWSRYLFSPEIAATAATPLPPRETASHRDILSATNTATSTNAATENTRQIRSGSGVAAVADYSKAI